MKRKIGCACVPRQHIQTKKTMPNLKTETRKLMGR
jgi:hypothetical protein